MIKNLILFQKSKIWWVSNSFYFDGLQIFNKKPSSANNSGGGIENENMWNQEQAEEFHKSIIRKFEKRKAHSSFIDKIWGADLADIKLMSKFNKAIRFVLCVMISLVNTHELLLWKIQKVLQLLRLLRKS